MAVKRRIVWVGDDDWKAWVAVAAERNQSVSALLREMLRRDPWVVGRLPVPPIREGQS